MRWIALILVLSLIFQDSMSSDFFHQHFKSSQTNTPSSRDEEYYNTLGVPRTATEKDVKAAYRKKAMQIHPDKGGNEEEFKKLVEAYEVLSDQNKRKLYDKFGKAGIKGQPNSDFSGASGQEFRDFFRSFQTSFPVVYNVEISLEDFFKGRTLSVILQSEKFTIDVEPGMYDGTEIRGQIVDRAGNVRPVVLILQEREHPIFRRKNADLYMECTISLAEVLLGFERIVTHLDGSQFTIRSKEGDLVHPEEVFMIENLGMPVYRSSGARVGKGKVLERGRLFIKMKVEIPSKLSFTAEERQLLQKIFQNKQGQRFPHSHNPHQKKNSNNKPSFVPVKSDLRSFGALREEEDSSDDDFGGYSSFFFR